MTTTPAQAGPPLLRELIDIPERIHQGDFVLRLTEVVKQARSTSAQAQGLISGAVQAFMPS